MDDGSGQCPRCGASTGGGQRFCHDCGTPLAGAPEERRWVTVVFADLSGFTSLSEEMDPEDVRDLVDDVMSRLVPVVQAHGGWVNRVIGDALLAAFGAPVAHEDDPERAVRAALALQQEVALCGPHPGSLTLRIGVNSGDSMLGTVGPELTLMGDAVNVAARLQTAARPGQVLVGQATAEACGPAIRFRPLGDLTVKGKRRTVMAYEPLAASPRPERRRTAHTTPLVGRGAELRNLVDCWQSVLTEVEPRVVVLVGEGGLGKSRLAEELVTVVSDAGGRVLHGKCQPYGEVLGYRALAEAFEACAGIDFQDDAMTAGAKLNALLGRLGLADTDAPGHLRLLTGVGDPADDLVSVPQARLHRSVRTVLEAAARERPTCLVLDDVHWADPALLDLFDFLAGTSAGAPLLVLATARPDLLEERPRLAVGLRRMSVFRLDPLDALASARLATTLCSRHSLPLEYSEPIERSAGGNPLFAEEVAAALAIRGDVTGNFSLPGSLKASITARLDGLDSDERALLQVASVIGLTFWRTALQALGNDKPGPVLDRLERRGLTRRLERSELGDEEEWTFKHGLIRDVAYEMLPRARRRQLHRTAMDWLATAAGDRVELYLDVLAHHALAAERLDQALDLLDRAAERARRAAAHRAEADLLAQAIDTARRLDRANGLPPLQARRGRALARLGAWAEARAELESALQGLTDVTAQAEAEVELSEVCFWLFDIPAQRVHATAGLALAEATDRADLAAGAMASLAQAEQAVGDLAASKVTYHAAIERAGGFTVGPLAGAPLAFYLSGDIAQALIFAQRAAAAANQVQDVTFTMWALSYLGLSLAANGRYDEADQVYREARRFGDEFRVAPLTARAVAMASGFRYDLGDLDGALAVAEEARDLARSAGFVPTVISAGIDILLARARCGEPGDVTTLVDEVGAGIETTHHWHEWLWRMRFAQARAELALATGDAPAGRAFAQDALTRARHSGRRKYEADALAAYGRALAQLGEPEASVAALQRGLSIAQAVSDPALVLRVAGALFAVEDGGHTASVMAGAVARINAGLPENLRSPFDTYVSNLRNSRSFSP